MRGTLKALWSATNLVATAALTACAGHEAATGGVAKGDVLPRFQQSESHYKKPSDPPEQSEGAGARPGMIGAMFDKGGHSHIVECHHSEEIGPKPTSGEPRAICNGPEGLLRICEEDWS